MIELSLVVPCFDEEAGLPELRRRLESLPAWAADRWEAVLVDDASRDGTWDFLRRWRAEDRRVRAARLRTNAGTQTALLLGAAVSRGAAVAFLDADLQDPPEDLAGMLARLRRERLEAVIGVKTRRTDDDPLASALKAAATAVLPLRRGESDFGVHDRALVERMLSLGGSREPVRARRRRALAGRPAAEHAYARASRAAGLSRYGLARNARLWWSFVRAFWFPYADSAAPFPPPPHELAPESP